MDLDAELVKRIQQMSPAERQMFISVYERLQQNDDAVMLSDWIEEASKGQSPLRDPEATALLNIFGYFYILAKLHIKPFASRAVEYCPTVPPFRPDQLPESIRHLAADIQRYGEMSEDDQAEYIDSMTKGEARALQKLSAELASHNRKWELSYWLENQDLRAREIAALAYCVRLLEDAGYSIEPT